MVRRILQLGDPTLRQTSCPVRDPAEAAPIIADLRDTLADFRRAHGYGRAIAAVQIGVPRRVIYYEFEGAAVALINPSYDRMSDEKTRVWDDCFSFPDLLVRVERSASIAIHYLDETGASRTLEASGPLSELLQHEMDHLEGILAIDRALDRNSFCTREQYNRGPAFRAPAPTEPGCSTLSS